MILKILLPFAVYNKPIMSSKQKKSPNLCWVSEGQNNDIVSSWIGLTRMTPNASWENSLCNCVIIHRLHSVGTKPADKNNQLCSKKTLTNSCWFYIMKSYLWKFFIPLLVFLKNFSQMNFSSIYTCHNECITICF